MTCNIERQQEILNEKNLAKRNLEAEINRKTKRLFYQVEAQLRNTKRDLDWFTRQLNEKQNAYNKRKDVADKLNSQTE